MEQDLVTSIRDTTLFFRTNGHENNYTYLRRDPYLGDERGGREGGERERERERERDCMSKRKRGF